MNHIKVKNLSVCYNDYCALERLNFEVMKGEFVAILGKSGSGKTTFLHALAHFIPFSGQITIPENIGMIFQQYAVFPWLTVSKNIAFGLGDCPRGKQQQIVQEYVKLVGLKEEKGSYSAELSSGQVQRVALARSLVHNPEILLMDEPYGALDAYTRSKMQQWLLDIWVKYKKTIIFVTHNIEEAIFLADRVIILKQKRFMEELNITFARPRREEIKFTPEFNELERVIFKAIQ